MIKQIQIISNIIAIATLIMVAMVACNTQSNTQKRDTSMIRFNKLTPEEEQIIVHKGTEFPGTGEWLDNTQKGTYTCKRCDAPLYSSDDKFESHCGWPSFDDELPNAIKRIPDADGRRTEIVCKKCDAHLGHVFEGERYTAKNTRHCVNSISMNFTPDTTPQLDTAYFASGCFWGTEYHFMKADGVQKTTVGYMGGIGQNPTYKEVCTGKTGHAETVEIVYDTTKTDYDTLVKLFFETHDFTQLNRQGPDIGTQYRSVIFYRTMEQQEIAEKYIDILFEKGYEVETQLSPVDTFWNGEDYHQQYYEKKNGTPYCHIYKKIF